MNSILYIEPNSGIAGDMFASAVIDLIPNKTLLFNALNSLSINNDFEIKIEKTIRNGITANIFKVITENKTLHGRTFCDIQKIINSASGMTNNAKILAVNIFKRLAKAEAKVHNAQIKTVHFHEVGAIDAIIDICTASIAIDILKPDKIVSLPTVLGNGTINSAHGIIPIPSPATLAILENYPVKHSQIPYELTTPTGAAILTEITDEWGSNFEGICNKIGYGAGTRVLQETANLLRISTYETNLQSFKDKDSDIAVIECNIDDMPGEQLSFLGPELLKNNVLDYSVIPATMKKNRHGFILQILCKPTHISKISELILNSTTTLGVRHRIENRYCLERTIKKINTCYGTINVKFAFNATGELVKYKAEQDDIVNISKKTSDNYIEINKKIDNEIKNLILHSNIKVL
ncbi:MAG TPA: nickel pincer cofactor biosynthesis protein LarC [Victivallales bacterium]|nr:nickel pincer cofactor biosynthesis protein LarC [Victivallales bacterium]